MKYFNQAAVLHHQDEEQDLLPMLQATARDQDASLLQQRIPQIVREHHEMDALWQRLNPQLQAIVTDGTALLEEEAVQGFCAAYTNHMEIEEADIAPMAKRLFDAGQMARLGQAMRTRRNLT